MRIIYRHIQIQVSRFNFLIIILFIYYCFFFFAYLYLKIANLLKLIKKNNRDDKAKISGRFYRLNIFKFSFYLKLNSISSKVDEFVSTK